MTVEFPGNIIPAPGYWKGGQTVDDELMYSMAGYTQKGITLAAGEGVIQLGTMMGRVTATKLWVPYDNAASDGSEVARGLLRQTVDTGSDVNGKRFQGNLVIQGIVKNSKVYAAGVDSTARAAAMTAGIADLKARVDTILDTFTF